MSFIPKDWCWTSRLEAFAQQMAANAVDARRQGHLARLLRDRHARRVFLEKWDHTVAQFAQCAQEPAACVRHDPEALDLAAIEIRALCAHFTREQFPGIFRVADDLAEIADRTRTFRLHLHLACPDACRRAAHRAPAQA